MFDGDLMLSIGIRSGTCLQASHSCTGSVYISITFSGDGSDGKRVSWFVELHRHILKRFVQKIAYSFLLIRLIFLIFFLPFPPKFGQNNFEAADAY